MLLTDHQKTILRNLVQDISGNDGELVGRVEELFKSPPELTPQALGFYPRGDESIFLRVLLGAVTLLREQYVHSYEDKYIYEFLPELLNKGILPKERLCQPTLDFIGKLDQCDFDKISFEEFCESLRDINLAFHQSGYELLVFDLSYGDSFLLFTLPIDKATQWENMELERQESSYFAIRSADWEIFLNFFTYATGLFSDCRLPEDLRRKSGQ